MYLYIYILMFYNPTNIIFQEQKINNLNLQSIFDVENKYNLTSYEIQTLKEINMNFQKKNFLKY
jgi:hypothetical protein